MLARNSRLLQRFSSSTLVEQIRLLRDSTGAPLLQCKKILVECDGNIDKAQELLRERNLVFAEKKANAVAKEGLWGFLTTPDRKGAILANLNSETDFVAKGEDFRNFLKVSMQTLLKDGFEGELAKDDEGLEKVLVNKKIAATGENMKDSMKLLTAKTKEKIEFGQIVGIKGKIRSNSS